MALALFDLDNTLLAGDSDHAWLEFLSEQGVVDGDTLREANDRYYRAYLNGTLDIEAFLSFVLAPLAEHPRERLETWHRQYMEARIAPMITDAARALVEKHREAGDTLLIITATNRFVTGPIAAALGVPELLATEVETDAHGAFTGRSRGVPCFREGKVQRLAQWLDERGWDWHESMAQATFYSDSHNDLPLLEAVAQPVAVDPDPKLQTIAQRRGWPILHLHGACRPAV